MSKMINYTIKFLSDWHCGSGLSSGADLDLLVVKDKDGLPFVPGKTIKGLVRETVEEIAKFRSQKVEDRSADIDEIFGVEANAKKNIDTKQGCCFFKNAELPEGVRTAIVSASMQEHLYRSIAQTAIDDEGIAVEHSLRKMEVTVPCELEGEILDVPDDFVDAMTKGLKLIKRLGQNRNRGLGRCVITVNKGDSK